MCTTVNTVLIYWIDSASFALPSVPVVMYVCVCVCVCVNT